MTVKSQMNLSAQLLFKCIDIILASLSFTMKSTIYPFISFGQIIMPLEPHEMGSWVYIEVYGILIRWRTKVSWSWTLCEAIVLLRVRIPFTSMNLAKGNCL